MANRYETQRSRNTPPERKPLSVRMPADLFAEVEQYAQDRGVSVTAAISELIGLGLDALEDDFLDDDQDDDQPSEMVVRVPR